MTIIANNVHQAQHIVKDVKCMDIHQLMEYVKNVHLTVSVVHNPHRYVKVV